MNGLEILENKSKVTFIQFPIINFYPSISKEILINSINYVKNNIEITDEQYQIILACRKTVLNNDASIWIKIGLDNIDVPMGGYDSTQIADLMGLYVLNTLSRIVDPIQIGLYQNDDILYIPIVMVLSVLVYRKRL